MRQCGRGVATRAGWAQVDVVPDHPCCSITERCPGISRVRVHGPNGTRRRRAGTRPQTDTILLLYSCLVTRLLLFVCFAKFWCVPSFPLLFGRVPLVCGLCVVSTLVGSPSELCELCPCPLASASLCRIFEQTTTCTVVYCLTVSQPGSFRTRQPRHHSRRQMSQPACFSTSSELSRSVERGGRALAR